MAERKTKQVVIEKEYWVAFDDSEYDDAISCRKYELDRADEAAKYIRDNAIHHENGYDLCVINMIGNDMDNYYAVDLTDEDMLCAVQIVLKVNGYRMPNTWDNYINKVVLISCWEDEWYWHGSDVDVAIAFHNVIKELFGRD